MDIVGHLYDCYHSFVHFAACFHPGPFDSTLDTDSALQQISDHHSRLEALREEESVLRQGLEVFNIEQRPSKGIALLEKV